MPIFIIVGTVNPSYQNAEGRDAAITPLFGGSTLAIDAKLFQFWVHLKRNQVKSVLDQSSRNELINRINMLDENSKAQWGQMNIFQMLKHCVLCEEHYLGKTSHKRAFMGRLFGKAGLKNILREDKSFPKSAPTSTAFKVKEEIGDVESEKRRWIALIEEYGNYSHDFEHWFFGKMTKEQVGQFVYKHNDHHLRQFNV